MQATTTDTRTDLVPQLQTLVRYLLTNSGRDFFHVVGELGLSISQVKTLHLLSTASEEASVKEIADALGLSLPATSRAVDDLVRRGYVTRTEDTQDRRMKRVRSTADGAALLERLWELRVAGLEAFVDTLSDGDRARLSKALEPILAREDVAAAAPRAPRRRKG